MTYDREDATRLAHAVYRQRLQVEKERERNRKAGHDVGEVVEALLRYPSSPVWFVEKFISKNPDVQYLGTKVGLPPAFLRRMVGWFGVPVVVEALRRSVDAGIDDARLFVGVCRNIERESKAHDALD